MEQQSIYDQFDWRSPTITDPHQNYTACGRHVSGYMCPSDPNNHVLVELDRQRPRTRVGRRTAARTPTKTAHRRISRACRTRANGGAIPTGPISSRGLTACSATGRGCKVSDVTDGLSNTLMLAEVTGGPPGSHAGFMWCVVNLIDTNERDQRAVTRFPATAPTRTDSRDLAGRRAIIRAGAMWPWATAVPISFRRTLPRTFSRR